MRSLYVRETSQHVKDRISKHKSTIRTGNFVLFFTFHFHQRGHTIAQLKYQVLEQVEVHRRGGNIKQQLRRRKAYCIHRLQTLGPRGLNRDYEIAGLS